VVEKLASNFEGKVDFAKVNVDESSTIAAKYGIMSIPTLIIFKDGKPVKQFIGFRSKSDFEKTLNELVENK
jgi:thioredoxin 1